MDDGRFDRFARAIAGFTSRRGLLGLAASMPITGGALALLEPADIQAKKRKKKKRKKKKKKTCTPDPKSTTCAGTCGSVINNCKQTVDCGSCACDPPCGECLVCNDTTGACVPAQNGAVCGAGPACNSGVEHPQDTCDGAGACQPGADQPCGLYECAATSCKTACDGTADCFPTAYCNGSGVCTEKGNNGESCLGGNECFSGACCGNVCQECCNSSDCSALNPSTPICLNNVCVSCTASPGDCPGDTCCNAFTQECVATCPGDDICGASNTCIAPCSSGNPCNADELCVQGICRDCTLFNGQSLQTAITNAAAGATLYLCPGTYHEPSTEFDIDKAITLIGAGDGSGGTLVGDRVRITAGADEPVEFRNLAIKGQATGVILQGGSLVMTSCTVFESTRGIDKTSGTLVMHDCKVLNNICPADGAGIRNTNGSVELHGCLVQGNAAPNGAGILTQHQSAQTSSLTLNNTVVRGNTATTGVGAGIYNFQSRSVVTISSDSVICENTPLASQCEEIQQTQCVAVCPT